MELLKTSMPFLLKQNISHSEQRTFNRSLSDTIIGFLHTVFGFSTTLWAIIRISIIGYKEAFNFGAFLGIYTYLFEATSILLWVSGIGLLRGKRWGRMLAAVWAGSSIFFHISSYYIRKQYWGELAPLPGWGEMLIIYYSCAYLLCVILKPAILYTRKLISTPLSRHTSFLRLESLFMNVLEYTKKRNSREIK